MYIKIFYGGFYGKTDFKVTLPIFKDNKYYITDFGAVK